MILVTFSYFIAGLIVDLSFVLSQGIGILLLSQLGLTTDPSGPAAEVQKLLNEKNVATLFWGFIANPNIFSAAGEIGGTIFKAASDTISSPFIAILSAFAACLNPIALSALAAAGAATAGIAVPAVLATCLAIGGGVAGVGGVGIGSGIVSLLVLIVLIFGLLQALLRLVFALLNAYVSIIFITIFGPFIILWSNFACLISYRIFPLLLIFNHFAFIHADDPLANGINHFPVMRSQNHGRPKLVYLHQ